MDLSQTPTYSDAIMEIELSSVKPALLDLRDSMIELIFRAWKMITINAKSIVGSKG